jgi:hypothetical protein
MKIFKVVLHTNTTPTIWWSQNIATVGDFGYAIEAAKTRCIAEHNVQYKRQLTHEHLLVSNIELLAEGV